MAKSMYSSQLKENGQQIGSSSEPELKFQQAGTVQVEDDYATRSLTDRTGTSLETLKRAFTPTFISPTDEVRLKSGSNHSRIGKGKRID